MDMSSFKDKFNDSFIQSIRQDEEEAFMQTLAGKENLPYIPPQSVVVNPVALKLVSEEKSRSAEAVAFEIKRKVIKFAVRNLYNPKLNALLDEFKQKGYEIELYFASEKTLEYMRRIYKDLSMSRTSTAGNIDISGTKIESFMESINSISAMRGAMKEARSTEGSATELVEILLGGAVALKSSDVHIEPDEEILRIRFRLDGILVDMADISQKQKKYLISRIKLVAGLKLNIIDRAQDGRFSINLNDRNIEVRVSSIPGPEGEAIVMRLLDPKGLSHELEKLGFDEISLDIIKEQIRRSNGIIINTGPTGSGKTTTLYSFLKAIVTPNIKIITLEDPVEYELEGIVQTQIDHKKYTFDSGLRAILRQDPDVIMVGEIRDQEVAKTALNAALSGHLVFSTLHTNNAPGGFTRLIDLGIDPKVMSPAINMVIAQRLVRKIIPEKAKKVKVDDRSLEAIKKLVEAMPEKYKERVKDKDLTEFLEPDESKVSDLSEAYKGRLGVFEILLMDGNIEKAVMQKASIREIYEASKPQGLPTLNQDALMKAIEGKTSLSEVKRVVDIFAIDR